MKNKILDFLSKIKIEHILIFAFFVRLILFILLYLFNYKVFIHGDSYGYIHLAKSLLYEHRFYNCGLPQLYRTPGYPLLLTLGLYFNHLILIIIPFQILLSTLTTYFIYKTTNNIFDSRSNGMIAALLFSLEPISIIYSSAIMSETLFIFFLAIFMSYLTLFFKHLKQQDLLIAIIALVLATFTRPIGLFIYLFILLYILFKSKKRSYKATILSLSIILISLLPIGAWVNRNYALCKYSSFSSAGEVNIYFFHHSYILSQEKKIPFNNIIKSLGFFTEDYSCWQNSKLNKIKRIYTNSILNHPYIFIQGLTWGMFKLVYSTISSEVLLILNLDDVKSSFFMALADNTKATDIVLMKLSRTPTETVLRIVMIFSSIIINTLFTFLTFFSFSERKRSMQYFFLLLIAFILLILSSFPFGGLCRHKLPIVICVIPYIANGVFITLSSTNKN